MSYKLIEKQVIYTGKMVRLELHHLEDDEGKRTQREICVHPGAVVILPFLDDKTVLLIRNRRYAVSQILLELPAGTLEKGEAPMNCAGRELQEETGYLAARIQPLGNFYTSPGILSEKMYAFAAYSLEKSHMALEEGEEIEVVSASLEDAIGMIRDGQIQDGKTIATLLMYERFLRGGNGLLQFRIGPRDVGDLMSWRDRDYNQSGYRGGVGNPILAALNGSVPLGTWFGIRVRVHASLILLVVLVLLFDRTRGYDLSNRAISMGMLFVIVLLHEFGHCFAARSVGGSADEIMMWPLGGLAFANAPHRPWPTFVTVIGGPLVNVIICVGMAILLLFTTGQMVKLDPFHPLPPDNFYATSLGVYAWWLFIISYILLLFNLLPIFPLDGGQLLQSILWPSMGYYRSMNFACVTGMVGAALMALYGLANGQVLLIFIAINGFLVCYQRRMQLREMGPEALHDAIDYSASLRTDPPRSRRLSRRAIHRLQRQAAEERAEQARIDAILDKVSAHGMQSLTWWERRALRRATERQRKRDLERAGREA